MNDLPFIPDIKTVLNMLNIRIKEKNDELEKKSLPVVKKISELVQTESSM
jgi:hypothetical protein